MSDYDKSMPIMPDEPLESEEKSQIIGTSSVTVKFAQHIIGLEIAVIIYWCVLYAPYFIKDILNRNT